MKDKRSLAQQIADLTSPAPTVEPGDEFHDVEAAAVALHDEELAFDNQDRFKGSRNKLQLRAAIPSGPGIYGGATTSKRAALGYSSESASGSDGSGQGWLDGDQPTHREIAPSTSGDSDLSGDVDAAPDAADDTDGLQSQYAQLEAADTAAVREDLQRRRRKDAIRGAAVARQRRVWEHILEMRILLQKALLASHRLPSPDGRQAALQVQQVQKGYTQLIAEATGTLEELLDLHTALVLQIPSIRDQQEHEERQNSTGPVQSHTVSGMWRKLEAARNKLSSFRDSTLDQWHRQVLLLGGSAAMRSNAKALGEGISAQVHAAMANPERLIARTQLALDQAPKRLCDTSADSSAAAGADPPERLADSYDDSPFYEQLLREFLEAAGAVPHAFAPALPKAHMAMQAPKKRVAQHRSSKGKRLRYNVQDKLVNFMAPVQSAAPPVAFTLSSSTPGLPMLVLPSAQR